MSYPPTFVKPPSTREQDEPRVSTGSTRAVTLGTSRQGPFTHQVTHLSQQASSSSRNRSNPLDQRAPRPHFPLQENPSLETDRNIRQVPSFKHRFLSRIMSSLINRPGSSHSTIEESGCRRHSAEVFPGSNAADHSSSSRRASSSTVDTCTSLDTDFETSLSAFPEPPVSNLTSPIEFSSFDHAQPDARAYRTLCAPADNAIVRPEITITPEIQTLNTDTSQSLYIAVQIGAVVEAMTNAPYNRHYGLDVAVVIDNS